jgi:hypothetical protein
MWELLHAVCLSVLYIYSITVAKRFQLFKIMLSKFVCTLSVCHPGEYLVVYEDVIYLCLVVLRETNVNYKCFKIFGFKREHGLYRSPSNVKVVKPRRLLWAEYLAQRGRQKMHIEFWWENLFERGHLEDL